MLRGILCLALGLMSMDISAAGKDDAWRKVEDAYAKGKPYKAIRACDGFLSGRHPEQRFLVLRAVGQNMLGYHEKALLDATKGSAHVHGDTLDLARVQIGIALVALGHADSARHWFTLAYDGGQGAEARRRMAQLEKVEGRCTDAVTLLDHVLRTDPDDAVALRDRGGCHALLGDTAAARSDLDRAIVLAPRDPVAWNSRGQDLYARTGHWTEALADFDRAIKLDPNYSFAFNNKGFALHKLGRTDKGLRAIALAGKKRRNNPFVPRNLGLIALDLGDTDKACGHFRNALILGFTAQYGTEVDELVKAHCGGMRPVEAPAQAAPHKPSSISPRNNAP